MFGVRCSLFSEGAWENVEHRTSNFELRIRKASPRMSFLAPLFLLGALAVVGPILFHLIRRTTREVTPFSSLMFLSPTPPRVTKRSRLENLWLLLLRCLVVSLLALGFARPFLSRSADAPPSSEAPGKRTVILVDRSASMQREQLWADALRKVGAALEQARPVDEVAVVLFDRGLESVVSFEEWRRLGGAERAPTTVERLEAKQPGAGATHLDAALLRAAEWLEEPEQDGPKRREIILISDLQEGSRIDGLQGYQWPRGVEVVLDPVQAKLTQNASVLWISEADGEEPPSEDAPLRLRVTNSAGARRDQLQLAWSGAVEAGEKLDAYVPAGQTRIVRAPTLPASRPTALTLSGDDTAFDNTIHILPPPPARLPVLFVGADGDEDPRASLYYLRRAFPPTRRQRIEIVAHRGAGAVPGFQLQEAQLAVLGEGASDAALAAVRQFARDGHIVLVPLTSAATGETLGRLLERPAVQAPEAPVKDYALLAQIDFRHPIFAPFADARFSDFTKIHFWKHRRLDPAQFAGARVVASFDHGDPAILQVPLGKGSVVVLASSWRPADSQLALSSKFVPLLFALLEQSSNLPVPRAQYFIGDELPLPPGPAALTVRKPDGTEVAAAAGSKFTATDQPGIYGVSPGTPRFVVNLAPDESRIAPLPVERFTSLGVPLRDTLAPTPAELALRKSRAEAIEVEQRQKLWRWLIVAALGVLLLETLIAGRLSRLTPSHAAT